MRRGLVIAFAVALGLGAVWLWLGQEGSGTHEEIDAASKAELERILREETGG